MNERFPTLEDVIRHDAFPEVDSALRAGRHVTSDELDWYDLLHAAAPFLEAHYRRWGLELTYRVEGYYFLTPTRDGVRRRKLTHAEMLVGQALALLSLDPGTLAARGVVQRGDVLRLLANLVGEEKLGARIHPRRKRENERMAQEALRQELFKAMRSLADLGFCETVGEEGVRLRSSIMRFADLARGADPRAALEKLVEKGEAVVDAGDEPGEAEEGP